MEVDFRIIVSISNVYVVRLKCMLKLNAFEKEEKELISMFSSIFLQFFHLKIYRSSVRTTSTPFGYNVLFCHSVGFK